MRRIDRLETARLLLRRWHQDDRGPFAAMNADPAVRRFFPDLQDRATSDASVDRFEGVHAEHGFGLWALERRDDGVFLGFTGLNPMPDGVPGAGEWEIGWRLAQHAWGCGYATEAGRAGRDLALRPATDGGLGLDRLWSMTAVLNTPSIAVMLRLGMPEAARFDHPALPPGHRLRPHVVHRTPTPR